MTAKKTPAKKNEPVTLEITPEGSSAVTFTIGSESVTLGREEVLNVQRQVTSAAAGL